MCENTCCSCFERHISLCSDCSYLIVKYKGRLSGVHQIALVGQEPVLFSRSLKDNIVYGYAEFCDTERLHHAATLSNAHDFISEMTDKYDTQAGEKGLQLSGLAFLTV